MKKIIIIVFFFGLVFPLTAFAAESVKDFQATIKISQDSSINVSEAIFYDFGNQMRHGIVRNIPISYQARGGTYGLRVSDVKVSDNDGNSYKFAVSYQGKDMVIKIGDANEYVTGEKTYVIDYTVRRAINYFSDHDELYWNVTGNSTQVPIEKASAVVILPQGVTPNLLKLACYSGNIGSQESCSSLFPDNTISAATDRAEFTQGSLAAGQGLTVVVSFPKGLVVQPSKLQEIWETVKDNLILLLPLLVFALLFYLWRTRGRDPQGRGVVVAQYEVPDNLTPAEAAVVIHEKADNADVSAEIINLAVLGYIRIKNFETKGLFSGKTDYELTQLKSGNDLPNVFQTELLTRLFHHDKVQMNDSNLVPDKSAPIGTVVLSSLKGEFYRDMKYIKDRVYDSAVLKGYFLKSPAKVRSFYLGVALAVAGLSFFAAGAFGSLAIASLLACAVIIAAFSFVMPVKTLKGAEAKEMILGLKEYLSVAEKDRIAFHNPPEKTPERFERLLPYAMALGVEEAWARQFEGIYVQPPQWYTGANSANFNSILFLSGLHNFSSSANSVLTAVPQNTAAGGRSGLGGFGGGGFSGGGFGGGGVGSW